jgi:hypothetical protein
MKINSENAEYLALAGYTETDIEKYFRLLNRKCVRGLSSLTVNERRFYNKARTDMRLAEKKIEAEIVAAQKRRITGKQPVENKLHYRWVESELQLFPRFIDLVPGEISAYTIFAEEQLAALRKYQPVLDQIDTSKRAVMGRLRNELLEMAASFGRVAEVDADGFLAALKDTWAAEWNERWSSNYDTTTPVGAAISLLDEAEFRAEVRAQVEAMTRKIYPSVTATV